MSDANSATLVERVLQAHRRVPTGLMVVTGLDGDAPRGLLVNSFNSISMDPPVVLISVSRSSRSHQLLTTSAYFGVNVLAREQTELLGVFASKSEDKFAHVSWRLSERGVPIIDGCTAFFEVQTSIRHELKSHTILAGFVTDADHSPHDPTVYLDRFQRELKPL